ncbi:MAG: heat-shock protein [Planctomycetota bacterium]|nr:MAG: heat-shock protein [Planctomycetota bacterium]
MKRYVVGIDLGTTNTVLAAAEAEAGHEPAVPEVMAVPQLVGPGEVEARPVLPSAVYLPAPGEFGEQGLVLPWGAPASVVGCFAREHGAKVAGRLVTSAKSWLCHRRADPRAPLLPLGAPPELERISPVEAQRRVLEHLVHAWDRAHPEAPLAAQEVLLAVPASFDAVARSLTLEAARAAGIAELTLLEEPQAAFYAWLAALGEGWRQHVRPGDTILVCDIGGGTTDFSLIACGEREGNLVLERVAVGEHLLLGGDNMDLALAHRVAARLGAELDPWQSRALWLECARAKEELLSRPELERAPVTIPGRGRRLVGGQVRGEVLRRDIDEVVIEGFFPVCGAEDRPRAGRRAALREIGLPYAADPAITRHLAAFLGRHVQSGERALAHPRLVLCNGGVMQAEALRRRLLEVLASWSGAPVLELPGASYDVAVARGAAYYGLVRRGRGIRIRGGSPRSYYVGFEAAVPAVPGLQPPMQAVCVVPFGLEEGTETEAPGVELGLVTGETVEFRLFASTARKDDRAGTLLQQLPAELEPLATLQAALEPVRGEAAQQGEVVPVGLRARLTEIGTLELFCVARQQPERCWRLEVNLRKPAD